MKTQRRVGDDGRTSADASAASHPAVHHAGAATAATATATANAATAAAKAAAVTATAINVSYTPTVQESRAMVERMRLEARGRKRRSGAFKAVVRRVSRRSGRHSGGDGQGGGGDESRTAHG